MRRRVLTSVVAFASLAILAWVLLERRSDFSVIAQLRPTALCILLLVQALYILVQAARHHTILNEISQPRIPILLWVRLFILGRFLNQVIPQSGAVFRAMELKRRFGLSFAAYIASFLFANWITTVLNLVVASAVVWMSSAADGAVGGSLLPILLTATLLAMLVPFAIAVLPRDSRLVRAHSWRRIQWIHDRCLAVLAATRSCVRHPRYLLLLAVWSSVAFVMAIAIFWFAFSALAAPAGIADVVLFYVFLQFTTYLSLTPGNLGVQEVLSGMLGALMGIGAPEGVLVSVLLRVTGWLATFALAVPLGGLATLRVMRAGGTLTQPQENGIANAE